MEDIFDFLTLKITATEFAAKIEADDHIINIIKTRIPDSKRFWDDVWDTSPLSGEAFHHDSYDLRKILQVITTCIPSQTGQKHIS